MVSHNYASLPLGHWAGADFQGTASQYRGVGADADIPDQYRFLRGVVHLLRRRMAQLEKSGESEDGDVAIFVLKPGPPVSFPNAPREPMIDNGLTMVVGRLWLTAAAVASAHYVDLPQNVSDDELFSFVADELGLGSQPALFFDRRTVAPELRWYPCGLGDPDKVEVKPLMGDVDSDDVFAAIDKLYRECLVTPASLPLGGNVWNDASKFWPHENVESLIQSHVKITLVSRFPFCTIRHEQTQQTGRSDLEIEQTIPFSDSAFVRHAIIELKVLRSFGSKGSPVSNSEVDQWIEDGVEQAAAYRAVKSARWSTLCCFDMRRIDTGYDKCFAHVRDCASKKDVTLWRWFLYESAASYRKAMSI